MTLILPAPEQVPITFHDVPELLPENLPGVLIGLHRTSPDTPSFGAFVIRNGGDDLANRIISTYEDKQEADAFSYWTTEVHTDSERPSKQLGITAYAVIKGSVEAIILAGVSLKKDTTSRGITTQLFSNSTLDTSELSLGTPNKPLRTRLDVGDVLVFDHTQPHAFRKVGLRNRLSKAHYIA